MYNLDGDYFDMFKMDEIFVPLVGMRFVAPVIINVCEAWSNALMLGLFNRMQKERVGEGVDFESHHAKEASKKKKRVKKTK